MSNRTELIDAINLKKPSRLPFTFDARVETREILVKHLGLPDNTDLSKHFRCNKMSSPWDVLGAGKSMPERMARLKAENPGEDINFWGITYQWQQAGDARYYEIAKHPLSNAQTVTDIEAYDWPTPDDVIFPEIPANFDKGDSVVLDNSHICPFGIPWSLRGMEQLMMDMVLNPEIVEAIVSKVEEYSLGCMKIMLEKYPGLVDMVGCGDDYGTQNGLLIGPDMVEQFFMPSLKRHYDLAAKHGATGYHHSCGAVFKIIPQFIAAGVKVLNPIQTSAVGMEPEKLKKEFGRDLCFHGGIDTQETLVTGTPEDVRAEVRERIDVLGPEGYILAPSHVLQPDVPPENIIAMYDEAYNYG